MRTERLRIWRFKDPAGLTLARIITTIFVMMMPLSGHGSAIPAPAVTSLQSTPRAIRLIASPERNESGTFIVALQAQGNENAVSFSLRFDPSIWRFVLTTGGDDIRSALININSDRAAQGFIGFTLSLPTGQALTAGPREIARIKLAPLSRTNENAMAMAFDDYPVPRGVTDAFARALSAHYSGVGRPRTITVASAASFSATAVASEALATAFGIDLAPATQSAAAFPLPTELAQTTVKITDSSGAERLAPLFFVSPVQINYQVPVGMTPGLAAISINRADGGMTTGTVRIAPVTPGLFTANANGYGVAAALALRIKSDDSQIFESIVRFDPGLNKYVAAPIELGDETERVFLILFGTGIRGRSSLAEVNVKLGGVNVPVLYAAEQGTFAGLDQINLRIPRSLAGSGEVDLVLTVDGQTANTVRVKIGN